MAQRETDGGGRRERTLVTGLWIAAAAIVVAGFLLRSLSSLFAVPQLRISGIALIAVGVAVAVLGWIGERIGDRRAH